jgi:hypothetical protein
LTVAPVVGDRDHVHPKGVGCVYLVSVTDCPLKHPRLEYYTGSGVASPWMSAVCSKYNLLIERLSNALSR